MKITRDFLNKVFSFHSPTETHYVYGIKHKLTETQFCTYAFHCQSQPFTVEPRGLTHVQTLTKQNSELYQEAFQQITLAQMNKVLINFFFIGLRLPYRIDQYEVQGFIWQDSVYSIKDLNDVQALFKEIKSAHQKFVMENQERLTSEKCSCVIQPITYTLEGIYTLKSIQTAEVNEKYYDSRKTKVYQGQILSLNQLSKQILHAALIACEQINQIICGDMKYFHKLSEENKLPVTSLPRKLFNPHFMAKTVPKEKYQLYFTKGIYQYFHYGDQKFSDMGWGCMYRSLQTLLSWLHLQDYYPQGQKMLTIPEIQAIIDSIDRTRKTYGTNDWIGSNEASWVVNKLTGINCRIIHIEDGQQILQNCQIFREHFEKVGSPIPYGGGQYAYSIVGINYNWKLGECQFLILDPHYSGSDDYFSIVEKKGVVWRKVSEMFKKGVFYNFCLPIIM